MNVNSQEQVGILVKQTWKCRILVSQGFPTITEQLVSPTRASSGLEDWERHPLQTSICPCLSLYLLVPL